MLIVIRIYFLILPVSCITSSLDVYEQNLYVFKIDRSISHSPRI